MAVATKFSSKFDIYQERIILCRGGDECTYRLWKKPKIHNRVGTII